MKQLLGGVLLALALLGAGGLGAIAADKDPADMNQSELNEQAWKFWQQADRDLNTAYKALVMRVGAVQPNRGLLLKAQLAWIPYRDAHSEFAGDIYRGGSLSPLIFCQAKRMVTDVRSRDIKDLAAPDHGDVEAGAGDALALTFVDAELNAAYKKLLAGEDVQGRALLQKAELAWIRFRDAECAFEQAWGGAGRPDRKASCLLHLTDARLTELKGLLAERKPH